MRHAYAARLNTQPELLVMRHAHIAFPNTQRGATLLLALLILIMIMMHGIPTVMNNTLNERMSGNTRNRDLAFQAAEHALKAADNVLINSNPATVRQYIDAHIASTTLPALPTGLVLNGETHVNTAAYWRDTFSWYSDSAGTTCNRLSPADLSDEIGYYAQPCYVIEKMTENCVDEATPVGSPCPADNYKYYYRVTARGVGKERDAIVILQAMYEFTK